MKAEGVYAGMVNVQVHVERVLTHTWQMGISPPLVDSSLDEDDEVDDDLPFTQSSRF